MGDDTISLRELKELNPDMKYWMAEGLLRVGAKPFADPVFYFRGDMSPVHWEDCRPILRTDEPVDMDRRIWRQYSQFFSKEAGAKTVEF